MKEEKKKISWKLIAAIDSIAGTAIVAIAAAIIVFLLLPKYSSKEEEEPAKA